MATQQEVLELAAKILDRLENEEEFNNAKIEDAILIVEFTLDEKYPLDHDPTHERMVSPSVLLMEATTDRVTVQKGMLLHCVSVMNSMVDEEDAE